MLNDNAATEKKATLLCESRNRIVGAIRQMLVASGSDVNQEPFVFMFGERFDFEMIETARGWAAELECDVVFVEFPKDSAALRPRSIHVVMVRDGVCWIVRGGDLWIDKSGTQVALVHKQHAGHLVCDGEELVYVSGKPADVLAPGVARGRSAVIARAKTYSMKEARRFFDPFARRAA